MNPEFQTMMARIIRRRMAEIEIRFITAIEEIEGRVPSNDEVRKHGRIVVSSTGINHFTWRGKILFAV